MSKKSTQVSTTPSPLPTRDCIPSFDERLAHVRHAVYLSSLAIEALTGDERIDYRIDKDYIFEALRSLLDTARTDLYWLTVLPAVVQQMPVPDDDEVDEASGQTRDVIITSYLQGAKAGAR